LISFHDIARIVAEACEAALADGSACEPESIEDALALNHLVRERTRSAFGSLDGAAVLTN
jgi:1-deoxy-D-xylulose-5-phosphate reductoisomerase